MSINRRREQREPHKNESSRAASKDSGKTNTTELVFDGNEITYKDGEGGGFFPGAEFAQPN